MGLAICLSLMPASATLGDGTFKKERSEEKSETSDSLSVSESEGPWQEALAAIPPTYRRKFRRRWCSRT